MSGRIPRLPVVQREPFLLKQIEQGAKILHIGCSSWPETAKLIADGSLFHEKLVERGTVVGIDIAEEGLRLLDAEGCSDIHQWDAMQLNEFPHRGFDYVVASDVIEHLANPGQLLEGVRAVIRPGGVMLLSTANAFSIETLLKLPFNWESVHAEHTVYFSYSTLSELASRYDFVIDNAAYYHQLGWRGPFNSIPHFIGYCAMRIGSKLVPHYASGIIFRLRARTDCSR